MEKQRNISKRACWCNGYIASLYVDKLSRPRILLPCFISLIGFTFLLVQASLFTNIISPPEIPQITLPEGPSMEAALLLRREYHQAMRTLRDDVILGADFNRFLMVVGPLGVLSVVGNWFNFLTLLYLGTVILLTVPMLYESYEDTVDAFVEKALVEMKRQYSLLYEMVLHTIQNVISF